MTLMEWARSLERTWEMALNTNCRTLVCFISFAKESIVPSLLVAASGVPVIQTLKRMQKV